MKITGERGIGNLLKVILQISLIIGIIILIGLYSITKIVNIKFDLFIIMIYPCGISLLLLMYQFVGLFNSLKHNNPFCLENVQRMKKGMISSFIISLLIAIALLLTIFLYDYYSLQLKVALAFMSILFFGVGIALYILAELFNKATTYKEENDLTI